MEPIAVKCIKTRLCECNMMPCFHFTAANHCISLKQCKFSRNLLNIHFNFAIFMLHLIRCSFNITTTRQIFFIKRCIQLKLDLNAKDPKNGKTAAHYIVIYQKTEFLKPLMKAPSFNVNILDDEGLPPCAYEKTGYYIVGSTSNSRLRSSLMKVSKKLFNFIFKDIVPSSWNSLNFATNFKTSYLRHFNNDQWLKFSRTIRDVKGNTVLHVASKANHVELVRRMLLRDSTLQLLTNNKNKLAVQYCKSLECLELFETTRYYRKHYQSHMQFFPEDPEHLSSVAIRCPSLVENFDNKSQPFVVENMLSLMNFLKKFDADTVKNYTKYARDISNHNIYHYLAVIGADEMSDYESFAQNFDRSILDDPNVIGSRPLHKACSELAKTFLLKMGAHPDCMNLSRKSAIDVINLECLSAKAIPVDQFHTVPEYFLGNVKLHHFIPPSNLLLLKRT